MNLPIVDFQTAKDLKELSFDPELSSYWYNKEGYIQSDKHFIIEFNWDAGINKEISHSICAAPTQAEVCKWLRDKYAIHVWAEPSYHLKGKYHYMLSMNEVERDEYVETGLSDHDTYEQAELVGIKKVIEILKERKTGGYYDKDKRCNVQQKS